MRRLPYEFVILEADKLIIDIALFSIWDLNIQDKYILYLDACGWTVEEFEAEMLKQINNNWIESSNKYWN